MLDGRGSGPAVQFKDQPESYTHDGRNPRHVQPRTRREIVTVARQLHGTAPNGGRVGMLRGISPTGSERNMKRRLIPLNQPGSTEFRQSMTSN